MVQLVSSSRQLVDVMATFDDCAMVNCIDTAVFEGARATLSSPGASPRVLRMANGVLIPSGGCWRSKISVGGVITVGRWEIFLGGGAWQMLLGKPMLKAFGASHEYVSDTVMLNTAAGKVTLQNAADASAEGSRQNKVAVAYVSDPGECLGSSPLKPGQVDDSIPSLPVDHAPELQGSVAMVEEPLEADLLDSVDGGSRIPEVAAVHASDLGACDACLPPSAGQVPSSSFPVSVDADPVHTASYSAQKRAHVVARKKCEAECARAREALLAVWSVIEESSNGHRMCSFLQLVWQIKSRAEWAQRILLCRWYSMPWDAGTVSAVTVDTVVTVGNVLIGSPMGTADGKVSLQEVEDRGDVPEVKGLRNQSRYASTSNPGQCCGADPLRQKGVAHVHSPACTHHLTEEVDQWLSVAELEGDENTEADGLRKTKVTVAHTSNPGGSVDSQPLKHRQVLDSDKSCLVDKHKVILAVFEDTELDSLAPGTEQPEIRVDEDASMFTRHTDPFNPARIARILEVVEIGDDITPEERAQVEATIREYADVYVLSVSEVKVIPRAVHYLHIPVDVKLNTRIQQRRLTPPQTSYFSKALDTMLDAGIIEPIAAADVKCVSPITLAAKAHGTAPRAVQRTNL
ncbi:hypothetical protein B0H10DRAFT_2231781 [Mycena sp. CBHHK59/15]|nr:hypothetical protein B0H10DRAFT_2231781 [Mycena sp. CBHHK59/15]